MNVSELKKLETTGYSSKLDEIAKNDTEVFLKVKLSGRRTFGEYEFEPKNGFAVHFGNHIDVLDLDKCDVYQLDQPQLNENQQIVLEWLKGMCPAKLGVSAMVTAYCLVDDNINDNWQEYSDEIPEHIEALQELSVAEENQVLEVFANWALEQEEE